MNSKKRAIFVGLLFLFTAGLLGCGRSQAKTQTNTLEVHLEANFFGTEEVIITVDGREVYRDKPKTFAVLGAAGGCTVSNVTAHPTVTFSMPAKGLYWSNQVHLSNGAAIGFSWMPEMTNGVLVRQAAGFMYD